jgi:hypothetical protein
VGECYLHTVEVTGSNPVSPIYQLPLTFLSREERFDARVVLAGTSAAHAALDAMIAAEAGPRGAVISIRARMPR